MQTPKQDKIELNEKHACVVRPNGMSYVHAFNVVFISAIHLQQNNSPLVPHAYKLLLENNQPKISTATVGPMRVDVQHRKTNKRPILTPSQPYRLCGSKSKIVNLNLVLFLYSNTRTKHNIRAPLEAPEQRVSPLNTSASVNSLNTPNPADQCSPPPVHMALRKSNEKTSS